MTFNISSTPSIDYSGSSLRFGLLDIKPIEVVETVKKLGMKFRIVKRGFEQLKAPQTYSELVTFQHQTIINSLRIPDWFDADRLIKEFSQRSIETYENDVEFKKAIDELKKADRKDRPLTSFVQFAKNRFESEMELYLDIEAERFMNSNLPLSFYNKFVLFDNTYYDFIKILKKKVRRYESLANVSRNFDMYRKKIREMKSAISPLIGQIDVCFLEVLRLKKYVTIWNSKDYNEIQNPKFLDINNLNYSEFENLFNSYNAKLTETRRFLAKSDEEMLQRHLYPIENATKEVFSRLITIDRSY